MTYEAAENFIDQNRGKIGVNLIPVIASNTYETRNKERRLKEITGKDLNGDTVLKSGGGINSDLNVFLIGQGSDGLPVMMPLSNYLEMIP